MKAILLAAGLGTRLRPLTDHTPKCLVPIAGKPLLQYWLELVHAAGIDDILINLHYKHEQVREFVAASTFADRCRLVFEEKLLGTGGTLLANRDFAAGEPVWLVHADNLSLFDPRAFEAAHLARASGAAMTMMLFRTDTPRSCGIVDLDAAGLVRGFHEKVENPPGDLANGAVYICEPEIVDFLAGLGKAEIDFSTEVIPAYLGRIQTFLNEVYHRDIGTNDSYAAAQDEFGPVLARFRTEHPGLL